MQDKDEENISRKTGAFHISIIALLFSDGFISFLTYYLQK